jgi:ferrous iron transport protein B
MGLIFWLTFGVIGAFLSDALSSGIEWVIDIVRNGMTAAEFNPVVTSLVCDGALSGIGSVLSFVPTIVVLFLFLSLLEDSGYMARVAFVMDKLLRKIGLSGRSFVPMLIGFGCSVPAIMSARTLSSDRDRKMTIFLVPFMSCSAKLPIYGIFSLAFFPHQAALSMILLYLFGIISAILVGLVLKNTAFRGNPVPFVMELPNYRFPSAKTVALLLWDKAKDFIQRAFTVIFVASIIIWFLQTFDLRFNLAVDRSTSILANVGHWIMPIFAPLGFTDWRAGTALITGFMAKEAVVSTFAVLTGASAGTLSTALAGIFTPLSAASFLVFTLLYTPCVAAIATVRKEMNSRRAAFAVVLFQTGFAWAAAFVVYQLGSLIFR